MNKQTHLLKEWDGVPYPGLIICDNTETYKYTYVAGPDVNNNNIFKSETNAFVFIPSLNQHWQVAPLAWIENKPVYKDDVLYVKSHHPNYSQLLKGNGFIIEYIKPEKQVIYNGEWWLKFTDLTWEKPKDECKTECKGWVNIYQGNFAEGAYSTREIADRHANENRVDCVEITWYK